MLDSANKRSPSIRWKSMSARFISSVALPVSWIGCAVDSIQNMMNIYENYFDAHTKNWCSMKGIFCRIGVVRDVSSRTIYGQWEKMTEFLMRGEQQQKCTKNLISKRKTDSWMTQTAMTKVRQQNVTNPIGIKRDERMTGQNEQQLKQNRKDEPTKSPIKLLTTTKYE